jgi:hypothetical protein
MNLEKPGFVEEMLNQRAYNANGSSRLSSGIRSLQEILVFEKKNQERNHINGPGPRGDPNIMGIIPKK